MQDLISRCYSGKRRDDLEEDGIKAGLNKLAELLEENIDMGRFKADVGKVLRIIAR